MRGTIEGGDVPLRKPLDGEGKISGKGKKLGKGASVAVKHEKLLVSNNFVWDLGSPTSEVSYGLGNFTIPRNRIPRTNRPRSNVLDRRSIPGLDNCLDKRMKNVLN